MISGKARLAGVLGWPIAHSLSPALHNHWFERGGIDGAYVPLAVRPEHLEAVLEALPKLGFLGVNITLPHKERAFELTHHHDPVAARLRAVNTVLVGKNGRMLGCNTDGYGFMANLERHCPSWTPGTAPVVIIGAGGAARAVLGALIDAGARAVRLTNRTRERAEKLTAETRQWSDANIEVIDWSDRHLALDGAGLCVNCSSLGMHGQPALQLDIDRLPRTSPVADIVYTPLETALLATAAARGHPTVEGLGMLLHQAVPGFRHWGGAEPTIDGTLRDMLLDKLRHRS